MQATYFSKVDVNKGGKIVSCNPDAVHEMSAPLSGVFYQELNPISTPSTSSLTTAGKITTHDYRLDRMNRSITDIRLRLTVSASSADLVLCPTPFWIDRIEILESSSKVLQTIRPLHICAALAAGMDSEDFIKICSSMGFDSKFRHDLKACEIKQNASKTFILPVFGSIFDATPDGFPISLINGHLIVRFHFVGSVYSGSGVPSLDTSKLVIESRNIPEVIQRGYERTLKGKYIEIPFLDTLSYESVKRDTTNSTTQQIPVPSLIGKSAFDLIYLQSTTATPLGGSNMNFYTLGKNGTFEILDAAGKRLLGDAMIDPEMINFSLSRFGIKNSDFYMNKAIIAIPHSVDLEGSFHGKVSGFCEYNSTRQISLTPSASKTDLIFTVTVGATGAAGYITYGLRDPLDGHVSYTKPLAYNESSTNIASAISALPSFPPGCVLTVSAALTNPQAVTFTFNFAQCSRNSELYRDGDLIIIPGNGQVSPSIAINAPTYGHLAGSYQVVHQPFFHKKLYIRPDGILEVVNV